MPLNNSLAAVTAGTAMDLVDSPNATAQASLKTGLGIGALTNTGGAATLTGILGDVANSSIAARLTALANYVDTLETSVGTLANSGGTATLGGILGDVANSDIATRLTNIYTEAKEVADHFHTRARWFGKKAVQTATDWADDTIATPYRAISGANAYGTDANDAALVFGTADTVISAQTKFDLDKIMIVASSVTTVWKLRFIYGSGTMADAIAAGQYSETMVQVASASSRIAKEELRMPRRTIGTDQIWCQAWNASDDATIDFFVGIHGYTS